MKLQTIPDHKGLAAKQLEFGPRRNATRRITLDRATSADRLPALSLELGLSLSNEDFAPALVGS